MKSTFRRVVAAFSLVSLITVLAAAPSNAADTPTGEGGTSGSVGLLSAQVGDPLNPATNPLNALIVGEINGTSIDTLVGTPAAGESINPLAIHSAFVPGLDALSTVPIVTSTTGAQDQKTTQALDLGALTSPVLPGALTGLVNPATLTSVVDAQGARSSLSSSLANLSVLLGTLKADTSVINVGGNASPTSSIAGRSVELDGITALNLGDLINLLGFSLDNLSPDLLAGLVDQLGVAATISGLTGLDLSDPGDLATALGNLQAALFDNAQLAALCDVGGVLVGIVGTCDFSSVSDELDSILGDITDTLSTTALLAIDQIKAAAGATAADTIANSAAAVTGSISSISIGGLPPIGPIDATATAAQIQAFADQANTVLHDVLDVIGLGDLLSLKLFSNSTNVFQEGDYVKSVANITALELTITPPDLCALFDELGVNQLGGEQNLLVTPEDLLGSLGLSVTCQVPIAGVARDDALAPQAITLPLTTSALTQPLTFKAASVSSAANFRVVAAPAVTPDDPALPRTGINETLLLVIGGLMALAAVGVRRATAVARVTSRRR